MRYNDKKNHNTNSYTSCRFHAHQNTETHAKNEERVSMNFWKVFRFFCINQYTQIMASTSQNAEKSTISGDL